MRGIYVRESSALFKSYKFILTRLATMKTLLNVSVEKLRILTHISISPRQKKNPQKI